MMPSRKDSQPKIEEELSFMMPSRKDSQPKIKVLKKEAGTV